MHEKTHQRSGFLFSLANAVTHFTLAVAAVFISFFCVLLDYASDLAGACVFILIILYVICLLW